MIRVAFLLLALAACQPEEPRAWQRVGDGCAFLPIGAALVPCQE